MPVGIRNLGLLACLILLAHWASWYYLNAGYDYTKVIFEAISSGIVAAAYAVSSRDVKAWLKRQTQSIFGSRKFTHLLSGIILVTLAVGSVVAVARIQLPSTKDSITVDGNKYVSTGATDENVIRVYGISFSTISMEIGGYSARATLTPFIPNFIRISENDLFANSSTYRELRSLLMMSFFQFLENTFLSKANNIFDTEEGKHFLELNKVYQILRLCFVEKDVAGNAERQFDAYRSEYKRSAWLPLLRACISYSQRQYKQAASYIGDIPSALPSDMAATYAFFHGVNELRYYSSRLDRGKDERDVALSAIRAFSKSESLLKGQTGYFVSVAKPSAQIFTGITKFYTKNLEAAEKSFAKATVGSAYPGLKSRAYNDLGYVDFIRGDLSDAESHLLESLNQNGTYPLAKINLGYVYMAEGKYSSARKILAEISADKFTKYASFRDTLLAGAALGHLSVIEAKTAPNPDVYDDVLSKMKLFNYAGIEPVGLRLAYIHESLGDHLYTSQDYYGLEIFAADMYALAHLEAKKIADKGGNAAANKLAKKSLEKFRKVVHAVNPGWLTSKNNSGFFAPVYTVLGTLEASASK